MKAAKRTLLCSVVWVLFPYTPYAYADWAQSTDVLVVRPKPAGMETQPQNPPSFTWARHPTNFASYTLEIRQGETVVRSYTSTRNWYLPSKSLPNGNYTWRVRPTSSPMEWSTDRAFVISAASLPFELAENDVLRATILRKPRPRALQLNMPLASEWSAAIKTERSAPLLSLTNEVVRQSTAIAYPRDSDWPLVLPSTKIVTAAFAAQMTSIRTSINLNTRQLTAASLLYRLTGEERFLTEALKRGDALAALNPAGPTSYLEQNQGSRATSLALIRAVDSLGSALDATRRAAWLNVVKLRVTDFYNDMSANNGRIENYPYESNAHTNLFFLALISALSVGDIPEANTWFDFSVRYMASSLMVWSGPEGGYSEGTAYAEYTADYALQTWPSLEQATGINLFAKPWSAGLARFFMHFVPPGTKTHLFGDGQENEPVYRFEKAFVSRFATPQAAWYVRNMPGTEDALSLLLAPYPLPVNTVTATPAPPANAALYPSIGWVAMHSDLKNLQRTSVYFKASPYGAISHGHGNQNGFVLTSAGVPLISETGWYDWFGSPMHTSWYRQTKSANALTYDGGVGQVVDGYREPFQSTGYIKAFSTTPLVDYVQGDSTLAYGGALGSAVRQVWYLRQSDAVVVRDKASSATKRLFEWNFHALAPILVDTAGKVSIVKSGRSVCVTPIVANGLRFERRTGPPPQTGVIEDHGVFLSSATSNNAEFLMLLDVGCKKPLVSVAPAAGGRNVTVGTQTIFIAD